LFEVFGMDDAPVKATAGSPPQPTEGRSSERVVTTRELLAGRRRIWIEHDAVRYLLQVTRSGKLILTK
jgi:hemin uptake protein HemP